MKVQEQKTPEPSEAPDLMPEELAYLRHFFIDVLHTGSRVICSPPVLDTDDDWIVLCKDKDQVSQMETFLRQSDFYKGGSEGFPDEKPEGGFHSWKKKYRGFDGLESGVDISVLNIILTDSQDFFDKSSRATWLAKKLNLLEKDHRILVFRAIREGLFTDLPEKKNRYHRYSGYSSGTATTIPININAGAVNRVNIPHNVWQRMFNVVDQIELGGQA